MRIYLNYSQWSILLDGFRRKPNTQEVAFRNGTLQAAYFMVAARAVGLDCGPMSGFNQQAVNETFFLIPRGNQIFV